MSITSFWGTGLLTEKLVRLQNLSTHDRVTVR